jgi:CheY-like chemotaxis protein
MRSPCPGWGCAAMLRGTSGGALGAARLAWSSSGTGIAPWHGGTSRTVLVVDNEADLLGSCERLLGPIGHRYLGAGGGLQAIELIDRMEPDLLVTDLRLPGVDGLAVARHARARVPPIPVILMSAYDSPWARRSARRRRSPLTCRSHSRTRRSSTPSGAPWREGPRDQPRPRQAEAEGSATGQRTARTGRAVPASWDTLAPPP